MGHSAKGVGMMKFRSRVRARVVHPPLAHARSYDAQLPAKPDFLGNSFDVERN
jgi:hypothetical protein